MNPIVSTSTTLPPPPEETAARTRSRPAGSADLNGLPGVAVPPTSLNLGDIYFTLFRHKWKILLCTALGIVAAVAVNRFNTPTYQSEAKLFVRYVIAENRALGPTATDASAKSPDQRGETIMKSEAEILTSLDIAKRVAETIGPEKILARAGGGKDLNGAIALIKANLGVAVAPASSVIDVTFAHPDPELVQPVLREVIDAYRKLHVETHTANGMLGDFLAQETDQLHSRLSHTEDELRKATSKAGIISLEDARKAASDQLTAIHRDLLTAQADLAERTAMLASLTQRRATPTDAAAADPVTPGDALMSYSSISGEVQVLQKTEQDLLVQFTPASARVKEVRAQLAAALEARDTLERKFPQLVNRSVASGPGSYPVALDPAIIATQIAALQAKVTVLTAQLDETRRDADKIDQMEGPITELRRKRELEDANYRYYSASLEQSRINETLGNGSVSNISQIQAPSPPFTDRGKTTKLVGLILAGGFLGGIAWAFLIDLYFDHTIKRVVDAERTLRVPLFLAIPLFGPKQLKNPLPLPVGADDHGGGNGKGTDGRAAPPDALAHPLQAFHETLRDRLIAYFESINLTHKPKLVAVTGLGRKGGVTTTAAGLARSLSETDEGSVLLVDMNVGPGAAQQFMRGKEVRGLDQFLDGCDGGPGEAKLCIVSENDNSERLSRTMPHRFSKLVPKLKASDFDYIIFDMPPISQISITPRLAGFMDMVLLVIESEKNDRELVNRATALLAESRTHVGVVLNKTRRYIPARLHQDNLGN